MFITLKRIIRSGFKTFLRNGFLSASSILVMTITMVIILTIFFSTVLMKSGITFLENKVDVNIYFTPEAPADKVLEFKKLVLDLPQVNKEKTNFVSKEESLKKFREKHKGEKLYEDALEIIDTNPLGAVLNIKTNEIGQYSALAEYIESKDVQKKYGSIIHNLNYNRNKVAIENLNRAIKYTYKIGGLISLILIFISIVVTFNTMRLIIYTFKEEISIMRLVGASKFFARGPFVVEGMLYGIISAFFALFITWGAVFYISPYLSKLPVVNINQFFSIHILEITGILILGGIILGFISTYLAVSRYLKV